MASHSKCKKLKQSHQLNSSLCHPLAFPQQGSASTFFFNLSSSLLVCCLCPPARQLQLMPDQAFWRALLPVLVILLTASQMIFQNTKVSMLHKTFWCWLPIALDKIKGLARGSPWAHRPRFSSLPELAGHRGHSSSMPLSGPLPNAWRRACPALTPSHLPNSRELIF